MDKNINSLFDFINIAGKNRKYPPNVASGFKTALKVVEEELNEEEKASIELIKSRLEQIFQNIYMKKSTTLSAASIGIYKRRIRSLLEDFEKYGQDPSKIASWNREVSTKKRKKESEEKGLDIAATEVPVLGTVFQQESGVRNEVPLENGRKVIILTPSDLNPADVDKISAFLTYLRTITGGNIQKKDNDNQNGGLA